LIDLRGSIYFQINAEAWNFFKSSLPAQNSDQYWASVLAEGERLARKYEGTAQSEFARDQIFAVVNELERIRKAGSFDSLKRPGTEKN
jgi:hypothetical protein